MPSFELTFLGTGTSQGIPVIGCKCAVCLSEDPRDKRTRTSILVKTEEKHFVIDTSPDFRNQCLREDITRLDAAIFTHPHTDHIMGFDDMRRFCEMQDSKMPIFASPSTMSGLRDSFRYAFDDPKPWKNYLRLAPEVFTGPFLLGDTNVIPVELPHGKISTTGYVFHRAGKKLLAYYTDCDSVPPLAVEAAQGAELLIIDALRDSFHPTHMNFEQALEAVAKISPREAFLIHFCHDVSHARKAREMPSGCRLSYDGLKVGVGRT